MRAMRAQRTLSGRIAEEGALMSAQYSTRYKWGLRPLRR
jgi:hypothetical protein